MEGVNTGVNSITFVILFSVCVDKRFSWHVKSLPSRGRDAQTPPSLIIRNVEGEGGRGKKGNGFLAEPYCEKMEVTVANSGQPSDCFQSAQGKSKQR